MPRCYGEYKPPGIGRTTAFYQFEYSTYRYYSQEGIDDRRILSQQRYVEEVLESNDDRRILSRQQKYVEEVSNIRLVWANTHLYWALSQKYNTRLYWALSKTVSKFPALTGRSSLWKVTDEQPAIDDERQLKRMLRWAF